MPDFAPFEVPADSLERQTCPTEEDAELAAPGAPDSTRPLRPQRTRRSQPEVSAPAEVVTVSESQSLARLRPRTLMNVPAPGRPLAVHAARAIDAEALRRLRPRTIQGFPPHYFTTPYAELQRRPRGWPIVPIVLAGVAFACAYMGVRLHIGSSAAIASPEPARSAATSPAPIAPSFDSPYPSIPQVPVPIAPSLGDRAPTTTEPTPPPGPRVARSSRAGTRSSRAHKADSDSRDPERAETKAVRSAGSLQPPAAGASGRAERPLIGEDLRAVRGARTHYAARPAPLENPFR